MKRLVNNLGVLLESADESLLWDQRRCVMGEGGCEHRFGGPKTVYDCYVLRHCKKESGWLYLRWWPACAISSYLFPPRPKHCSLLACCQVVTVSAAACGSWRNVDNSCIQLHNSWLCMCECRIYTKMLQLNHSVCRPLLFPNMQSSPIPLAPIPVTSAVASGFVGHVYSARALGSAQAIDVCCLDWGHSGFMRLNPVIDRSLQGLTRKPAL